MKLIQGNSYSSVLLAVKDIPDIKVITGVRRSGKSKLIDSLVDIIAQEESAIIVRIKLCLLPESSIE